VEDGAGFVFRERLEKEVLGKGKVVIIGSTQTSLILLTIFNHISRITKELYD